MDKPVTQTAKKKTSKPGIFSLLKPYSGMVAILIIMALLGSAINMLIPKIIAHGIDSFSANQFNLQICNYSVSISCLLQSLYLHFCRTLLQTYASERVGKDLRTQTFR